MISHEKKPLVYILILNWNSSEDVQKCIESFKNIKYSNYKVLILDNASSDKSGEYLKNKYSQHEYIQTGSNLGYAGGNNIGIRHAIERGADFIWILNPDVTVEEECLGKLVHAMETDSSIGVCGPSNAEGITPNIFVIDRVKVEPEEGYHCTPITLEKKLKEQDLCILDTDHVVGCSIFIRKKLLYDIGLFREDFFLYCEEMEFTFRAKRNGWRVASVVNARIRHHSDLPKKHKQYQYYLIRNIVFLARSNKEYVWKSAFIQLGVKRIMELLREFKIRGILYRIKTKALPVLVGLFKPLSPIPRLNSYGKILS